MFTIRVTRIPCKAVDGSGNTASCSSHVVVRGKFVCAIIESKTCFKFKRIKNYCLGMFILLQIKQLVGCCGLRH